MDDRVQQRQVTQLAQQRRRARQWISGLFILCVIESCSVYHLLDERTTLVIPLPTGVSEPFRVSAHQVSASYLAEMTRYFTMLRLNYTPATVENQAQVLLQYTDGRYYGTLKEQWAEEIEAAKANDLSLSFSPVETRVDLGQLTVWIDGDLIEMVGKMPLGARRVTYAVRYRYEGGQLRVLSMTDAAAPPPIHSAQHPVPSEPSAQRVFPAKSELPAQAERAVPLEPVAAEEPAGG